MWRWRPAPARHYWAREIGALGHETRLIPPAYVKPFVKRQKNDMADAEAICEAAQRPTMRFVTPKSAEAQAAGVVFRTRDLLVRQRTQLINALRGHLAEFGMVARKGPGNAPRLIELVRGSGVRSAAGGAVGSDGRSSRAWKLLQSEDRRPGRRDRQAGPRPTRSPSG